MDGDAELLRDYAINRSERAFAHLVERHIDLVYSAALRRVGGDPHRAAEVTQMVFIDLARKATSLVRHPLLTGWLHQSTRWAANNLRRAEQRRVTHERAAAAEWPTADQEKPVDWTTLRPLLDEALDALSAADREAVLLRFFNNCSFAEVGRRLGTGENAARMRVERALDKLHGILRRKGLVGGVAALGAAMVQNAVAAAPTGLAATVTPIATAAGATVVATTTGVVTTILMSKLTMALIGAGVVTLAVLCFQQQATLAAERIALVHARQQHAAHEREASRLAAQVERLQVDLARLPAVAELPPASPAELERKRLDLVVRKGELDYYAPLFRRMRLTRAQVDAFKTLIVERNQALYDANQLAKEEGVICETLAEAEELRREATRAIDARIENLLGTENAQLFVASQGTWRARLLSAPPLENPKEEAEAWARMTALDELEERTARAAIEQSYAQNTVVSYPPEFLEGAKAILPETEYRALLADNEATRLQARMIEIARAAAYAGKLKLSKGSARDYARATSTP